MEYLIAIISITLGATAQLFLKLGVNIISKSAPNNIFEIIKRGITNIYLLSGVSCYVLSLFLWFYVLSRMELSKAYPLVSLGYVFTLFLGFFFLQEAFTISKVIGITMIIIGVFVLTR